MFSHVLSEEKQIVYRPFLALEIPVFHLLFWEALLICLVLMTREHCPGHLDGKELFIYHLSSCSVVVQPLRMRRARDGH